MPPTLSRLRLPLFRAAAAVLLLGAASRPAAAWVTRADLSIRFSAVAADSSGNALAAGRLIRSSDSNSLFVASYGPDGVLRWQATEDGGTFQDPSGARAIVVDPQGNAYVAGTAAADGLDGAFV